MLHRFSNILKVVHAPTLIKHKSIDTYIGIPFATILHISISKPDVLNMFIRLLFDMLSKISIELITNPC